MELLEIVERVGAYAGFFAVVGLAVLSALYFSQARDVRRLREWAGRAPERAVPGPAVPTPPKTTSPAATGAAPARSAAGAAAATSSGAAASRPQAGASSPGGGASTTERPGPGAVPGVPAPAESGNGTAGAGGGAPPPVRQTGPVVSSRTQSIPRPPEAGASSDEGPRLAPRYVALIVAGVLILGAGIAYAVVRGSQPDAPPPVARTGPAPVVPADVTVSVLNGTTQPGLAARVGDRVESAGFRLGNVTNASEQQRAESVILYMAGADREARVVGRRLRIAQTERADAGDRVLAGTARVIVMVGADEVR